MNREKPPSSPDAPASEAPPPPAPTSVAIWIHDGPVCVTVVDPPPQHVSSGLCRCPACLAHDPDRAFNFF